MSDSLDETLGLDQRILNLQSAMNLLDELDIPKPPFKPTFKPKHVFAIHLRGYTL